MSAETRSPQETQLQNYTSKLSAIKSPGGNGILNALEIAANYFLDPQRSGGLQLFVRDHLMISVPLFVNPVGIMTEGGSIYDMANEKRGVWVNLGNQVILSASQLEAYSIFFARKNRLRIPEPIFLTPDIHIKVQTANMNVKLIDQMRGFTEPKIKQETWKFS